MNEILKEGMQHVTKTYDDFLSLVIEKGALKQRIGPSIEKVDGIKRIDVRTVELMTKSGKGGFHTDPKLRERFKDSTNVTLLDHLLSVCRGAMIMAVWNWGQKSKLPLNIDQRLACIATVGFLHDLDKILNLPRSAEIKTTDVEKVLKELKIGEFIENQGLELKPDQILSLIGRVESSQSFRYLSSPIDRNYEQDCRYIALADKLDGLWLKGGVEEVLNRIKTDQSFEEGWLPEFKVIDLYDPHHPFLLDDLQLWISTTSIHKTGIPPLLEVHHDGRLVIILPEESSAEIIESALGSFLNNLPFGLSLTVSNRGVPQLRNIKPSHEQILEFVENEPRKAIADLFKVKAGLINELSPHLDKLMPQGAMWPAKILGALASPLQGIDKTEEEDMEFFRKAGHLALLLEIKLENPQKGVLNAEKKESDLIDVIQKEKPEWISKIKDDPSRRKMLALWTVYISLDDPDLIDQIWGDQGLLQEWLEGTENNPGLKTGIPGDADALISSVESHFKQLLEGKRLKVSTPDADHYCLFTNEPVDAEPISAADELYQVKVSAFSGRDGRLESISSDRSETHVSPVSKAEHRLRTASFPGGKPSGVPSLISSPSTQGLFGGLLLTNDRLQQTLSVYDLSRQETKKGRTYKGWEVYRSRHRLLRYERMPERLQDQINLLGLILRASLRIGRPVHLFRGLPVPRREFFYCDALPKVLENLLGGRGLRLEQIPQAIENLKFAEDLMQVNGLGFDVMRLYAKPATRFQALCLSYSHTKSSSKMNAKWLLNRIDQQIKTLIKGVPMQQNDQSMIEFGKKAAMVQQYPRTHSNSEELMTFKLCLDAVLQARKANQTQRQSLVYAVADALETNLVRRNKAAAKAENEPVFSQRCMIVAESFVDEVWFKTCNGRTPSQATKRILGSIFRIAFLNETGLRQKKRKEAEESKSQSQAA